MKALEFARENRLRFEVGAVGRAEGMVVGGEPQTWCLVWCPKKWVATKIRFKHLVQLKLLCLLGGVSYAAWKA